MRVKTLESPLDSKVIRPVNPKGKQSWIFTGRTDSKVKAPNLWWPDVKNRLTGKDPDAGKDWRQEEKGMTEDEMVGWHHWLNGHEFEEALGDSEGQRGLTCCSPWVAKSWTQLCHWTTMRVGPLWWGLCFYKQRNRHQLFSPASSKKAASCQPGREHLCEPNLLESRTFLPPEQ